MNCEAASKTALVTGSSSGIGRGIAHVLAREGADIVVNYRSNRCGAEALRQEIENKGRKALVVQADISKAGDVDRLIQSAIDAFGKIDILVNNAGITTRRSFLETDEDFFDTMIGTDFKGAYLCSRRASVIMKKQHWGRIINISSLHDKLTSHEFSIYAAAKGALNRLTAGMAVDLAEYGITVNAVSPGWVPVESEGEMPQQLYDAFCKDVPLGRPGKTTEVGELVSFLASERASWITGQVVYIDGGSSCMIHMPSRRRDGDLFQNR